MSLPFSIVELTRTQQLVGYIGAGLAAGLFGATAWRHPWYLAIGLVLAAALAVTVHLRKPTPVVLAAVGVSFGPWSAFALGGAVYIGYGAWVMMTTSRAAREERMARRAAERRTKEAEARAGRGEAGRHPPAASKRYTPPASKRRARR